MADLQETQKRHADDIVKNNIAGLMGDFTPAAMSKVMALASNPITATSYEINDLGNNEVEITYISDAARRRIWSRWEDTGGKWQIADVEERTNA